MLRKIFYVLTACAALSYASSVHAGVVHKSAQCLDNADACTVLHRGKVRGRSPLPKRYVCIPYVKKGYGEIALFVLKKFDPAKPVQPQLDEPGNATFKDSKITGPVDDFCRNLSKFVHGHFVVLCDEWNGSGYIGWGTFSETLRKGRPPRGIRVEVGLL